jgi:hypothetical protein
MLNRFRDRFGTAGLIVAVLALILAVAGTALAAGGALTGKQKKEVTKIAKKYAGKPGAPGAQGPAGPQGAAGTNGKDGSNGTNGKDGVSAEAASFSGTAHGCQAGGIEVKSAKPAVFVCNGKAGTFSTEALPSGQTLTGIWGMEIGTIEIEGAPHGGELGLATISFPIRVTPAPTQLIWVKASGSSGLVINPANGAFVKLLASPEEVEEACPGSAADPQAVAGNVCMYTTFEESVDFDNGLFAHPHRATSPDPTNGAVFPFLNTEGEPGLISGSWAVTAG